MSKGKILVVEDDAIIGFEISERLTEKGFTLLDVVSNGKGALEALVLHKPDLVLMDIHIKGNIDGIETATKMNEISPIPIIYLTAYSDSETLKRVKDTNPYGYLLKPFNQKELESTIEVALHRFAVEKLIKESEKLHKALFEQVTDGILLIDSETRQVISANPAYLSLSGYSKEEILELTIYDLAAHSVEDIDNLISKLETTSKFELRERKHKKKDGTIYEVELTANLISSLNKFFVCIVVRDVSSKRLAEKELKQSEERYRKLFENMTLGVVYHSSDFKILSANQTACKFLGLNLEELIGLDTLNNNWKAIKEDGSPFPPEEQPAKIAFDSGHIVKNVVIGLLPAKHSFYRWFLIDAVPEFKEGEENPYRVFETFSDITERKEQQDNLYHSERALKQLNESKDKFFSIVAHDLKSPFLGLLGFSDVLINSFDELSKDQIKKYIGNISKSTKSLYLLIEHLLEWSRLQTGRFDFNIDKISASKSVDNAMNVFSANAIKKEITIYNNSDDHHMVLADEKMLNSIFENLIANAIKFTPKGGEIRVFSRQINNQIEMSVRDNGIGINKLDLDKIFRLDINYTSRGTEGEEGTGLGLILCKEMVEKMGGTIWVESDLNKGATFNFTLLKA